MTVSMNGNRVCSKCGNQIIVSEKNHCCSQCNKVWKCPQENCKLRILMLCSKCFNEAKKDHMTPEFGEGK